MDINVEYGVARSYIFMMINNFLCVAKRSLQSLNDTTTITYYYCYDDDDAYQTVT